MPDGTSVYAYLQNEDAPNRSLSYPLESNEKRGSQESALSSPPLVSQLCTRLKTSSLYPALSDRLSQLFSWTVTGSHTTATSGSQWSVESVYGERYEEVVGRQADSLQLQETQDAPLLM